MTFGFAVDATGSARQRTATGDADARARPEVPARVRPDPTAEQPDRGAADALRPRDALRPPLVPLQPASAAGDARGRAQHVLRVRLPASGRTGAAASPAAAAERRGGAR